MRRRLMLSMPPAMTMSLSPVRICWAASATARRPEPQTWLMPNAVVVSGRPAARRPGGSDSGPRRRRAPGRRSPRPRRRARAGARHRGLYRYGAKLVRGQGAEGAVEAADGVRAAATMTISSIQTSPNSKCHGTAGSPRRAEPSDAASYWPVLPVMSATIATAPARGLPGRCRAGQHAGRQTCSARLRLLSEVCGLQRRWPRRRRADRFGNYSARCRSDRPIRRMCPGV